jgi:7-keto-8-aminopelargonate synthetase-like enzyme
MIDLAERHDAVVYVDDAHGTGVLGPTGGGTAEHFGVESPRIIHMGTLSKAYGCIGGFVATEAGIARVLRLGCSAYGFTSTLPPDQAMGVLEALDIIAAEPERRLQLWENQRYFVAQMEAHGLPITSTATPIVPLGVGDERACTRLVAALREAGIHVDAVMFPAVRVGQARLRFMLNARHSVAQIDRVIETLKRAM